MVDDVSPIIQTASSALRWGKLLAFIPMEMPYLLLNEDMVEDTHSGSSSGGMAAPQGTMPRFSPSDVKS